jgi:predicted nucleic acid-binding protein
MTLRVVIDTNIWIRILLKGRVTLPVLAAFNELRQEVAILRQQLTIFKSA